MKTLKSVMVVLVLTLSTVVSSAPVASSPGEIPASLLPSIKENDLSQEIGRMLRESELVFEKEMKVLIIFEVTRGKRILIRSILCRDAAVLSFFQERLKNRKLLGSSWEKGKLYAVPVRMEINS